MNKRYGIEFRWIKVISIVRRLGNNNSVKVYKEIEWGIISSTIYVSQRIV